MSAVKALTAVSHRESLSKTVKLLTRSGIQVQFRGHQPHVVAQGNKAIRLVLPELSDDASPELLKAINGFLDHEVGHIFYTPFARAIAAAGGSRIKASLINIIEDIRLEKLLPRDLPGTKENLERMYEAFIPMMIDPSVKEMIATGDKQSAFHAVVVPALRALAGQAAFKAYMDANDYWQHFLPLMTKMPDLARRLRALEDFDQVEELVEAIIEATKPPTPPPPPETPDGPKRQCQGGGGDGEGDDDADDDGATDPGDGEGEDREGAGGKGHGDGEGEDDGEGDDDQGSCAGDDADDDGDDTGSGRGKGEGGDDADDSSGGDEDGDEEDGDGETDDDEAADDDKSGPNGKTMRSITDALKMLDPTQRRALFMYKQQNKTVSEIGAKLNVSENAAMDLLRNARRRLSELMKGERA